MSNQVERVYRLEMLVFTKDQRINELEKELAALKTPPRCPKCGSGWVKIVTTADLFWSACDNPKCHNIGDTFQTIDAALNAWRKGETK